MDWNFADNGSGLWNLRLFGDVVRAELSGSGTRQLDLSVPHGDHGHDYSVELARGGNLPRIAPWRVGGELRWERGPLRASLGAVRYAEQDRVAEFEHAPRSEEHPSELPSLMRISYAVFCLKKKQNHSNKQK